MGVLHHVYVMYDYEYVFSIERSSPRSSPTCLFSALFPTRSPHCLHPISS
jgi:hypothetical protein